ncbi:hypothetical protein HRJ34_17615 [Rhizorhabdus wittichii]|uniref:Uncharacterized protein n=1 Tax=Rhizorhabdus wittichii TaxID=160791 RepID=A0A975CZN8_9SPHN|nr:hypothetical protein [Rhizorhabdus wittichii]QTH20166.1 hypothetical protein HRJ34_17615 [Rhizorhabdus wittichii]
MSTVQMCFLPYTPRADSDARGYEEWLRSTDNPFFNSRPGIGHYSNWKVASGDPGFTHFDILLIAPGFGPDDIWADEPLAAFAADWVRLWGVEPAGDPALNYHCHIAERSGGDAGDFASQIVIDPSSSIGESWTFTGSVVGTQPWPGFSCRFGDEATGDGLIRGELIAAPSQA